MVFNLATLPDSNDVQHAVCVREQGGALQAELERRGVPVYGPDRYYGARETRHSLRFMQTVVQREAVDIVHAHMADAAFLGWRLARRFFLPLVITHHGHDLLPRCGRFCRLVYYALLTGATHHANRNVAVSDGIARSLRRWLLLKDEGVRIISNGVPVPDKSALSTVRLRDASPRVITVGRLVELKGHEQLIAAASVLAAECPGIRFSIVGDGPLRERLQHQVGLFGLGDQVDFTGTTGDVPARLNEADIYVSTSRYEGMPMAVLEAMAWGVPVIASDVPGNRAVVEDGRTGLLYRPGDSADLVRRIREVMEQPEQAAERAGRARNLVEERFSVEASARKYAQLYADVMLEKQPGAASRTG